MIDKRKKLLQYSALAAGIAAVFYIWFYDRFFIPNPIYGDRASTASNVGRDHWAAFIVWGLLLEAALALNVLYSADKFGVKKKFVRLMCLFSTLGCLGFVICKNEKFKRFTFTLSLDQYKGEIKSDYSEHIFVSSRPLLNFFWSKKSMHSAFSVIFGVCLVVAVLYILISKCKDSKKFRILTVVFFLYAASAAIALKQFLGGTVEVIAITAFLIPVMIVNNTSFMEENN
ncbi:MAG: hypothetical protein K6B52_03245 [Clostridiales bacterium]|nr:hypothetical protein [Clostridiales bacterium]